MCTRVCVCVLGGWLAGTRATQGGGPWGCSNVPEGAFDSCWFTLIPGTGANRVILWLLILDTAGALVT